MSNETTCWAVFDSEEGGLACYVYRDVQSLMAGALCFTPKDPSVSWAKEIIAENARIEQWCQTARVGDVFSYRSGYIVRCLTPWATVSGPKEAEDAT